jgi:hypothetical protein
MSSRETLISCELIGNDGRQRSGLNLTGDEVTAYLSGYDNEKRLFLGATVPEIAVSRADLKRATKDTPDWRFLLKRRHFVYH